MIAGLSPAEIALCVGIAFVGALVQGSIGTGLGLLAAPILAIVDPAFLPGALVVAVVPLTFGMTMRERGDIDRSGVVRAFVGRVPGTFVGAWVAATASSDVIALIVGVCVLIAVVASVTGLRFEASDRNVGIAGFASGFTATSTGVGGPPMAITYQHANPEMLRSTLALFFLVGGLFSAAVLALGGVIGRHELALGALLMPGVVAGLAASRFTAARLPAHRLRPLVLAACSASAIALLVEQFI